MRCTTRFICGELASVQAMTSNAVRGFEVEDSAVILLRFESGALGTLTVSDAAVAPWNWELTSGENPFYPQNAENCYLVAGAKGAVSVPKLELWRYAGGKAGWSEPLVRETIEVGTIDPLVRQLQHFCRLVRGDECPRVTGADGVKTLSAVQAIFEAARSGRSVSLSMA
jgi:predicted dehydrogenase